MGKAFVYGMVGLISIGLLLGFGFAVKLLVLTFTGRRKKETREPLAHTEGCPCSLCRPGAGRSERMHKHY